ncbi:MAG: RNA 3'-terminal phosphate cyclase [Acidobacteriota bacterium]
MIEIDGSLGEGGGQVLRSAVALSMVTGTPIRVIRIRAGRSKPGLMRQHLTAVKAAATICGARVQGGRIGSTRLRFEPGAIQGGDYRFAIGTAGSTTLVLQTVLPALITAPSPSTLTLQGGTHNPMAPPFPFLADTFLPLINRMGPTVTATLDHYGFFPAGGGSLRVEVQPCERLEGFELFERGEVRERRATAIVARLPSHIAERELNKVKKRTGWRPEEMHLEEVRRTLGPGNVVVLQVAFEAVTETFISHGRQGLRAESVAVRAVRELQDYLSSPAPVGRFLADQLLLPLALAGLGAFACQPLSRHAKSQIELLSRFLEVPIRVEKGRPITTVRIG